MFQSILLIGVTGPFGLGGFVAAELAKSKASFNRLAIFNNTSRPTDDSKKARLQGFQSLGFEIVSSPDYTSPKAYEGFDCVMIFLGNHGLYLQPSIIDAAIEAGVRHFYPSEYGADILVGENWTQRYYKYKVETREHLQKRGAQGDVPDLGWTYYLLGRLTEWSIISHFGFDNRNAKAKIYGTSSGRQSLISAGDTAKYLVATLKDTSYSESNEAGAIRRTYRLSGTNATYSDIFEILKRLEGKTYEVTYLDVESAREEEEDAKSRGDIEAELAASHKLIQGREGTVLPEPWNNDRFPEIQPKGVEETLRAAFSSKPLRRVYGLDG